MKWLRSSVDPNKISLTIKSAAIFVPSLVILLKVFGFNAAPEDLLEMINLLSVVVSGIFMIYGLGRKMARKPNS